MTQQVLCALVVGAAASVASADILTQWNFNSNPPDASTSTGTTVPNVNITAPAASIVLQGGVTNPGFNSGVGSSDPAASDNSGYQTTTYPAQGMASGTAGVAFSTSTTGWQDIVVSWDQRFSNTSSRFFEFQYTLDFSEAIPTWVTFGGVRENTLGGDQWLNNNVADLTGVSGVDNNANFAFRVVSVFSPATGQYEPSRLPPASNYGGGTWRFDMVTVRGVAIPTPGSIALLGLGGLVALRRRR